MPEDLAGLIAFPIFVMRAMQPPQIPLCGKLTEAELRFIRREYLLGLEMWMLADAFGITEKQLSAELNHRVWEDA